MNAAKTIISGLFLLFLSSAIGQVTVTDSDAALEKKFSPYLAWRHGGEYGLAEFKKENPAQFKKELWYYSRSFTVKRNHLSEGVTLDESIIDISRFEQHRLQDKIFILELPGYKDALVLLPAKDLSWKPAK